MIVITSLNPVERHVAPGDEFRLTIKDALGSEVIVSETITVEKTLDFIASYRFTLEDGTCPGFHLCGIFGNKKELPEEFKTAKQLHELSEEQLENFKRSVGVKILERRANNIEDGKTWRTFKKFPGIFKKPEKAPDDSETDPVQDE